MKASIDAYIENKKTDLIEDIRNLIRIESIYGHYDANLNALKFVQQKAEAMGIACLLTREKDALLARIGTGKEKVGLLAHVDVVEIGDPTKWTHLPFSGDFDGEYLWGRGVLDDKGAVIASLYALKAMLDLNVPLNKQIWLIVGSGEEGGDWPDMAHFKRDFGTPDYGFSPDGDFPICNIESGYADIILDFHESARSELTALQAGASMNTIPSNALIQFTGEPAIQFEGVSAHSSTPEFGKNAIEALCRGLSHRQDLNFIRFIQTWLLDDTSGSRLGLNPQINDPAHIPGGKETTCVPTVLKLTDNGVQLCINVRQKQGTRVEDLLSAFESHAQEFQYSVKMLNALPGMAVDPLHPALQLMAKVYEEYGFKSDFISTPGTTYAKAMQNFVSWGPNFPEVKNCAHKEDEKISVTSLLTATKMYALFLAQCSTGPTFIE